MELRQAGLDDSVGEAAFRAVWHLARDDGGDLRVCHTAAGADADALDGGGCAHYHDVADSALAAGFQQERNVEDGDAGGCAAGG